MPNIIAYLLQASTHPIQKQQLALLLANSPSLYIGHKVLWYGISLCPVWVSCTGCAPSQLLVCLHAGSAWEAEKTLTAQQQLKLQLTISIILSLNPKLSTLLATKKKINYILAETRTPAFEQGPSYGLIVGSLSFLGSQICWHLRIREVTH